MRVEAVLLNLSLYVCVQYVLLIVSSFLYFKWTFMLQNITFDFIEGEKKNQLLHSVFLIPDFSSLNVSLCV